MAIKKTTKIGMLLKVKWKPIPSISPSKYDIRISTITSSMELTTNEINP